LKIRLLLSSVLVALVAAPAAGAHVSINPGEWEAGGFARFDVRVPNERDDAGTTRVVLQFPESVVSASFQDVPGWERTVEMVPLEEPIEEEGEEPITERIGRVTWSGGTVEPGEFVEFGVSFQVPETPGEDLLFPTVQTYSGGEAVRWISPDPEAEEPAPRVTVLPPEEEGGAETQSAESATTTEETEASDAAAPASDGDDGGRANLALGFGIAGLLVGLAALAVAFLRTRRA
jgi:periplasmic copper chaperone A